jgi:hypothetical protein
MSNQITLAFTVNVAGSSFGPVQAAAALAAVPLYANPFNDPVLGQFLGLTVASDTTTPGANSASRTIVLNMTNAPVPGTATAPPPSPCNPITATPPVLPYPLLTTTEPLPGSFLTVPGSNVVGTSESLVPTLVGGETLQFLAQPGVFYVVAAPPTATSLTLTTPYTGSFSEDDGAVEMIPAPAAIAAIYSTSPLDSAGVTITPALPPGSGARTASLTYMDSTGAGPFTVVVNLMGTYPSPITLAVGSRDIAVITDLHIATVGGFGNSVGQITVCELSSALPPISADATAQEFQALVDQAQMLITRGLVYLPPSYFALAQQGSSAPVLAGEFILNAGSKSVPTSQDQTGVLSPGNTIQFALQDAVDTPFGAQPLIYTIATVSPKLLTLTQPWGGLNDNPVASSATLLTPSPAAPPTGAQLASPLAEFVNPGTAIPPPSPPDSPQTMSPQLSVAPGPVPNFLSGYFARTLQLALAVPVVPSAITLS